MDVINAAIAFFAMMSRNRGEKRIVMRFFPNGTSAVDNDANVGSGITVTRTGVGAFTLTFEKGFVAIVKVAVDVAHGTAVYHARVVDQVLDASGAVSAIKIKVYSSAVSATATDIAADPKAWVSVEVGALESRVR